MKATRKLIPAFAMLLIAAVMMSTATFAWFTSNASVTAEKMQVTAKANTTYLMISNKPEFGTPETHVKADGIAPANTTIFPAAWDTTTNTFYSAVGTAVDDATLLDGTKKSVGNCAAAVTAGYAVQYTFYLKIAAGYENATNLRVTAATCEGASAVVVKCGDKYNYCTAGGGATLVNTDALSATVTTDSTVTVDVFVYIDGNDDDVTLENYLAGTVLKDLDVTLTFGVGAPAAVPGSGT